MSDYVDAGDGIFYVEVEYVAPDGCKVTTEVCKQKIVEFCNLNKGFVCSQFVGGLSDAEYEQTLQVKNWKRMYKGKRYASGDIERAFDCRPFDGQLRAYVRTDENDVEIEELFVNGE